MAGRGTGKESEGRPTSPKMAAGGSEERRQTDRIHVNTHIEAME
jgi:hypothetical protein